MPPSLASTLFHGGAPVRSRRLGKGHAAAATALGSPLALVTAASSEMSTEGHTLAVFLGQAMSSGPPEARRPPPPSDLATYSTRIADLLKRCGSQRCSRW